MLHLHEGALFFGIIKKSNSDVIPAKAGIQKKPIICYKQCHILPAQIKVFSVSKRNLIFDAIGQYPSICAG